MKPARCMVYVQHLLGTGHLKRAALLAQALEHAGHAVTLVSGGFAVPGLSVKATRFVQLAAVGAADLGFKSLVDVHGHPVDDAFRQARRDRLLALWQEERPQLLLVELFPFGRRQMRFELIPLLDAARAMLPRPLIVSSVRDVLGGGQSDPQRQQRMLDLFDRYFDHLLVHGDPALVPFGRSFAPAQALGARMHYTGYVVERVADQAVSTAGLAGDGEVIVSSGGGAVGRPVLEAAIRARHLCVLAGSRWRVLVGSGIDQNGFDALQSLARQRDAVHGGQTLVERNRPDFLQLLGRCRLSISQAGYNTVIETLHCGVRSVMVPFAGGSETEQMLRARVLAERGWIDMLEETELTPENLARAIDRAASRAPLPRHALNFDGAQTSARLITGWLQERDA